jgi:hypothetical protein
MRCRPDASARRRQTRDTGTHDDHLIDWSNHIICPCQASNLIAAANCFMEGEVAGSVERFSQIGIW